MATPEAAIASMKAKDGLVNVPLEVKRLKLTIETAIDSPGARSEGFGQLRRAPADHGRAGLQGLCDQEPRAVPCGVERQLPAQRCRAGHPAQALIQPPLPRRQASGTMPSA